MEQLLNKPHVNEVYLTGQTLTKNRSKPLDFLYTFLKGLDLSILYIKGMYIKGLHSYYLSKLEVSRKSLPPVPTRTSQPGFEFVQGQIILKV